MNLNCPETVRKWLAFDREEDLGDNTELNINLESNSDTETDTESYMYINYKRNNKKQGKRDSENQEKMNRRRNKKKRRRHSVHRQAMAAKVRVGYKRKSWISRNKDIRKKNKQKNT
jgi:hypothetical protein